MLTPTPPIDVQALMRGLVHELRNPLSAILTASSLLQEDDLDEERAMLLGVVQKESRRMNRILTEFSSFVRVPASHPETFDVARLVRRLVAELERDATLPPHIEVRDELPETLAAHGDPTHTEQALHHLLENAAQAMPDGGLLHLHADTETDAENIHLFLDDSGPGVPHDAIERAFQPFFSTKSASTGLGLSIADGLLRASGGQVRLSNRPLHPAPQTPIEVPVAGARARVQLPRGAASEGSSVTN